MKCTIKPVMAVLVVGLLVVVHETRGADWPQLQCDAQKSGFQPAETIPTVGRHRNTTETGGYGREVWAFNQRFLAGQPVVAEGTVVIGSLTGTVFALDELTGAVRWTTHLGEAVLNSCAIYSGRVVVATQAGKLRGLSITNGATLWTYAGAKKGYAAAPTIADGTVYIGSKDGRFHAVDALTGAVRWVFEVGGSADVGAERAAILCSAAVLSNRVFFGAENMHAYGLDRQTGQRLWRRRLTGQSFVFGAEVGSSDERGGVSVSAGWPVASRQHGGVVLFRTQPVYDSVRMLGLGENILESVTGTNWLGNPLGTTNDWRIEQRGISAALMSNAYLRTCWELDPETGQDKYAQPMPILWTSGSGNTPTPPVVDDVNNRAWIVLRSVYSRIDSGTMVRPYGELVKLHLHFDPAIYTNPAAGHLAYTHFHCETGSAGADCLHHYGDLHKVSDEGEFLTGCANAIVSTTWVSDGGWGFSPERTFNIRYYSPADLGEAPLYGASAGAVFANGRVIVRDTEGVKSYAAQ